LILNQKRKRNYSNNPNKTKQKKKSCTKS